MVIGSGAGASIGYGVEASWAAYQAPDVFLPADAFQINYQRQTQPVSGVAAGRLAPPDEVETLMWGMAHVEHTILRAGKFGRLFQHLTGSTGAPVQQAATTAYLQTHAIGDNRGKGLTLQEGLPDIGGTANPITGYGGKPTTATFSCSKGENLKLAMDFDLKKVDQLQVLSAPGYSGTQSQLPFHWAQMTLKLGTFGAEASVNGVKGVQATIARSMNNDDSFYAGNAGLKSEPITSGSDLSTLIPVTGTIDIDLATKADFLDRYTGHTSTSLVWDFTGPIIASTYAYRWTLKCPRVYFGGDIPGVSGAGVVGGSIPFVAFFDPTNGYATIEHMSTDLTI